MASNAGIFFAGVGVTFISIGAGFGGGVMMAKSALNEPLGHQTRAASEPPSPVRLILPSSSEAARAPQVPQHTAAVPQLPAQEQPVEEVEHLGEKQADMMDTRKAKAEQRMRRKHYVERKAKRQAERTRQQQLENGDHWEAPIMAFSGDERRDLRVFGN